MSSHLTSAIAALYGTVKISPDLQNSSPVWWLGQLQIASMQEITNHRSDPKSAHEHLTHLTGVWSRPNTKDVVIKLNSVLDDILDILDDIWMICWHSWYFSFHCLKTNEINILQQFYVEIGNLTTYSYCCFTSLKEISIKLLDIFMWPHLLLL